MQTWAVNSIDTNSINYPSLLSKIKGYPKRLYYMGEWKEHLFSNCLAVIGSRKISMYGKRVVTEFCQNLNLQSITIVSGFMTGVDWQAHLSCLENGGRTIAVLPWGIEYTQNFLQQEMLGKILEGGGLVISEYPGFEGPKPWTYPKRNRIVAGLCQATLVVEAGLGSGSLITADFSHSFDRKVFVIPGSIFSEYSAGCLKLLNSYGVGVSAASEINEFFGVFVPPVSEISSNMGLLALLREHPLSIEELSLGLAVPIPELNKIITLAVLDGQLEERGGVFYACHR